MKTNSVGFTGLILAALVASSACSSGLSETEQKANVSSAAKACVQAQFDHEAEKWINCIHPKILEAQPGGKAKMLKDVQEMYALVSKKIPYDSMNFDQPKEIKTLGKYKAAMVPYQIQAKDFDDKPKTSKDFLIGVSEDEGKTWKFANSSPESIAELNKTVSGVKSMETLKVEF